MKFSSTELRLLRTLSQMKQEVVGVRMGGITKQRVSQIENHPNLNEVKTKEFLSALGFTPETARRYLDRITVKT